MIKNIFSSITVLLLISCSMQADNFNKGPINGPVILNLSLISAIEGKSFGIDKEKIRALLIIRTQILQMLYGVAKDGKREGLYPFNGQKYTVEQLYKMVFDTTAEEKTLLAVVKADFETRIRPFLEMGRNFKPQMLIFIAESLRLHKRNHANSILLKWAETEGDNDLEAFYLYVNSFKDLSDFLYDLLNYLDDLVSSCPKAKQQFIDSLKTEQEKKAYAQQFQKLFDQQKAKINKLHQH